MEVCVLAGAGRNMPCTVPQRQTAKMLRKCLDADALPKPLARQEIRQAMEVLKMLSQSDLEREIYEGRLKARRDAQTLKTLYADVQQQCAEAERRRAEAEQGRMEAEQGRMEAEQQLKTATSQRDRVMRQASRKALVAQIQLCQRLLGHGETSANELQQHDEETLKDMVRALELEAHKRK